MNAAPGGVAHQARAVRVTVVDTWTAYRLEVGDAETVASVKRRALTTARIDPARAERYDVKVGGALVRDESRTLAAAGAGDGAALVILSRRRRPAR
jgi:hypothetical protein